MGKLLWVFNLQTFNVILDGLRKQKISRKTAFTRSKKKKNGKQINSWKKMSKIFKKKFFIMKALSSKIIKPVKASLWKIQFTLARG